MFQESVLTQIMFDLLCSLVRAPRPTAKYPHFCAVTAVAFRVYVPVQLFY